MAVRLDWPFGYAFYASDGSLSTHPVVQTLLATSADSVYLHKTAVWEALLAFNPNDAALLTLAVADGPGQADSAAPDPVLRAYAASGRLHKVTVTGILDGGWRENWPDEDKVVPDDMLEWFMQHGIRYADTFCNALLVEKFWRTPANWDGKTICVSSLYEGSFSTASEDFYFTDPSLAALFKTTFT